MALQTGEIALIPTHRITSCLLLPLLQFIAGCATVPLQQTGSLSSYERLQPADGMLTKKVPVDTTGAVMMHDFSVTESYAVFYDLPVTFRLDLAMDPSVPFPFAWDDEYPARVGVLSREPGNDAVRCTRPSARLVTR